MSEYIRAFVCGGLICAFSQVLIDRTRLTPARILTSYVVLGVFFAAIGVYEPIVKWGGCGATTPLFGFGYAMAKGVEKAVGQYGLLGALTGPMDGDGLGHGPSDLGQGMRDRRHPRHGGQDI